MKKEGKASDQSLLSGGGIKIQNLLKLSQDGAGTLMKGDSFGLNGTRGWGGNP